MNFSANSSRFPPKFESSNILFVSPFVTSSPSISYIGSHPRGRLVHSRRTYGVFLNDFSITINAPITKTIQYPRIRLGMAYDEIIGTHGKWWVSETDCRRTVDARLQDAVAECITKLTTKTNPHSHLWFRFRLNGLSHWSYVLGGLAVLRQTTSWIRSQTVPIDHLQVVNSKSDLISFYPSRGSADNRRASRLPNMLRYDVFLWLDQVIQLVDFKFISNSFQIHFNFNWNLIQLFVLSHSIPLVYTVRSQMLFNTFQCFPKLINHSNLEHLFDCVSQFLPFLNSKPSA